MERASYLTMALGHRSSEITYVTAHSTSFVWKQFNDHVLTINSISVPAAFPFLSFEKVSLTLLMSFMDL